MHVIYKVFSDFIDDRPSEYALWHRAQEHGEWNTAEKIHEASSIGEIDVLVDGNDSIHVIFDQNIATVSDCHSFEKSEIFYMNYDGSTWSTAENISNNSTDSEDAHFVVDAQNNIHVVWHDGVYKDDQCDYVWTDRHMEYRKNINSIWNAIEILTPTNYYNFPRIAITDDQHVHITYQQSGSKIGYIFFDNTWHDAETIFVSDGGGILFPLLTAGEQNTLHMVFRNYQPQVDFSYQEAGVYLYYDGDTWHEDDLFLPVTNAYHVEELFGLFADSNNTPHIIYSNRDRIISNNNTMRWVTKGIDGEWIEPQIIHRETQNPAVIYAAATYNQNNLGVAFSADFDQLAHVFVNQADLTQSYLNPAQIQGITVNQTDEFVEVHWDEYTYADFDQYNVYRTQVSDADISTLDPYVQIGEKERNVFRDIMPAEGNWYYTVTAVDSAGKESSTYTWKTIQTQASVQSVDPLLDYMEGENNWRRWGLPNEWNLSTSTAYSGVQSMFIDASEGHSGIQQLNIPVESGKKYRYSFKYNIEEGEIYPILGIRNSNADFEGIVPKLKDSDHLWHEYVREFEVPQDFVDDFRVRTSVMLGKAYIDDVHIEEIEDFTRVKNGDFETVGLSDWRGWGGNTDWQQVTSTVEFGHYALEIGGATGAGGIVQTNILVEAGKKYKLEFDYNVDQGDFYYILGGQ